MVLVSVLRNYVLFVLLVLLFGNQYVLGLPFVPRIENYSVHDYNAGNQNWAVAQDKEGVIYVGNDKGLLEFDGERWNLNTLPDEGTIRSLLAVADGRIYVGSFEEFGYFERNKFNKLQYHSLRQEISGFDFNNDEIWNIVELGGKVYFQTFSSYFSYDGKEVKGVKTQELPLNFLHCKDSVFVQMIGTDLSVFDGEHFHPFISREQLGRDEVVAVLPMNTGFLLVTRNTGIFYYGSSGVSPWHTSVDKELYRCSVNKAVMTRDSVYVLGTLSDGLYAIDKNGELLWNINTESKLQDNTVLGLFCDAENNIWVTLDNGIAYIQNNSDLYLFEPGTRRMGMVYDISVCDREAYIASNHGLYRFTDKLEILPGTEEQTWTLTNIDGQLICGHNKGTFMVGNGRLFPQADVKGANCIRKCRFNDEEVLVQSTYTYLLIFKNNASGKWQYSHYIPNFMQLIRNFETDHLGNIWAEHMHKGMYRVRLDKDLANVTGVKAYQRLGGEGNGAIRVFKIRGRVVFSDGTGFYTYQDLIDSIVPYQQLNRELADLKNAYKVVPAGHDSYWFISNDRYTLVDYENQHFRILREIPVSMFENPPVTRQGNIKTDEVTGYSYICLNGSVARYNHRFVASDTVSKRLWVSDAVAWNEREGGDKIELPVNEFVELANRYSNILISLACPFYGNRSFHIRYKLEGCTENWTVGLPQMRKEYTRLPYGDYCFKAEIFEGDKVLAATEYRFTVMRPWYLSYAAIIVYGLLFAGMIVFVHIIARWRRNRVLKQQQVSYAAELERRGKRIVELQNERLEAELVFKSKELSSVTMLNISNKEFLARLKEELQKQRLDGQFSKKFFDRMIHLIDGNVKSDDDWQLFQTNFDRIHDNFFRNLKLHYPDLTPNDLRLCAFLRLNLPTKDISKLMNISLRGVEAARYRLRKKLDIPMEKSLVDFMIEFK